MIGMNMRVKNAGNLPIMAPRQVEVHLGVKRGINHHDLLACTNEVRKAALSGAPHLKNMHNITTYRYFSNVPGQTPRLHPAIERKCLYPSCGKLLGGNQASFTRC